MSSENALTDTAVWTTTNGMPPARIEASFATSVTVPEPTDTTQPAPAIPAVGLGEGVCVGVELAVRAAQDGGPASGSARPGATATSALRSRPARRHRGLVHDERRLGPSRRTAATSSARCRSASGPMPDRPRPIGRRRPVGSSASRRRRPSRSVGSGRGVRGSSRRRRHAAATPRSPARPRRTARDSGRRRRRRPPVVLDPARRPPAPGRSAARPPRRGPRTSRRRRRPASRRRAPSTRPRP